MLGPLLKIYRSEGKVSPNRKGLIMCLLLWYSPSYWWHRVPCLGNLHDTWWMRQSLDSPSSPPENIDLPSPYPLPSTPDVCLAACSWWGRRGTISGLLLMLCPHGRVGGACFLAFCFVNFCIFCDFAEYGMDRSWLSELSCFYEWNRKTFPVCLS